MSPATDWENKVQIYVKEHRLDFNRHPENIQKSMVLPKLRVNKFDFLGPRNVKIELFNGGGMATLNAFFQLYFVALDSVNFSVEEGMTLANFLQRYRYHRLMHQGIFSINAKQTIETTHDQFDTYHNYKYLTLVALLYDPLLDPWDNKVDHRDRHVGIVKCPVI